METPAQTAETAEKNAETTVLKLAARTMEVESDPETDEDASSEEDSDDAASDDGADSPSMDQDLMLLLVLQLAGIFSIDRTTARAYLEAGSRGVFDRVRSGRAPANTVLAPELLEMVDKQLRSSDRYRTVASVIAAIPGKLSRRTVRRAIHQLGYCWRSKWIVPPLTTTHCEKRVKFAATMLEYEKTCPGFLASICFTDEKYFSVSDTNRNAWQAPNETLRLVRYRHAPQKMCWLAIHSRMHSDLYWFDKTCDAAEYQKVLRSQIPVLQRRAGRLKVPFDNARPHTAKTTMAVLEAMAIHLLPFWPACSPDLSPIEKY